LRLDKRVSSSAWRKIVYCRRGGEKAHFWKMKATSFERRLLHSREGGKRGVTRRFKSTVGWETILPIEEADLDLAGEGGPHRNKHAILFPKKKAKNTTK